MMIPLQAALLYTLPLSAAFSTSGSLTLKSQAHARHSRFVLPNHHPSLLEEDPIPIPSKPDVVAQDVVLANIENTSPASILAGMGAENPVQEGQEVTQSITENLEVVLGASENAMMLAEAALPAELKQGLTSFGANSTSFAPPISTLAEGPINDSPAKEGVEAQVDQETTQSIAENVEAVISSSESTMMPAEAALPADVKDALGSFGANPTSIASPISTPLEEPIDIVPVKEAIGGQEDQEITQIITENVEAVLSASENAMVLAEAALPADVKDGLGSFGANSTSFAPPISTPVEEPVEIVPSKEVVGEPATTEISAPSVAKILKFAIPAIGVWLCSPLLSLIDTSAVGVLAGTTQQAALNPAVAVTDYAALLIAFLFTASTNLIASAEESDRSLPGKPKTTSAMLGAMQMSTYVGIGLGAALFAFARPLLRAIIGNDAINPAVFAAAMKYVRIRALGMPAAAIIGSAQAGSLGAKDTTTPLKVLAVAGVVNLFSDMLFVGCKHPIIGGAAGAAWATVFSQYAALGLFVRWLIRKPTASKKSPKVVDVSKNIMDLMGKPDKGGVQNGALASNEVELQQQTADAGNVSPKRKSGLFGRIRKLKLSRDMKAMPKDAPPSVRGLLEGRMGAFDLLKLPSKAVAKEFAPYVAPVTVTQIGRVSGYVAMSHVVSSSLGTISMAAQQVIVSFFYCLTPIADSLSLTAQSFLPGISERNASKERADALRRTGRNFLKAGGVFGAVMAAMIGLLPLMSGFFTSDAMVVSLVNMVVPLLVAFFSVHGVLCAAEGVLLGQKDLGFLGRMYGAYFFAVPFFMLRVKRAALTGVKGINLSSVWTVFLGYQLFRLLAWVARVEIIQKRVDAQAQAAEKCQ